MADDSTAQKVDPSLVAEIVSSYVGQNSIAVDQLVGLIATVHGTLSGLGKSAPEPAALVPAVPIRRSVQHDHVVCLECGFRGLMSDDQAHVGRSGIAKGHRRAGVSTYPTRRRPLI
jgi:predicted transcriptional regulator